MRIFTPNPKSLRHVFGAFGSGKHIVSVVGGGGKTTLLYFMAERCARSGKRVLVTTTTHIYEPDSARYAATVQQAQKLWADGHFAVIGTPVPEKGKLKAPDPNLLETLLQQADVTLVEADGAKHCPIKVPRKQEPVVLPQSDLVLAVMGLSALGQPLEECCFGLEEALELLNTTLEHRLSEEDAALILSACQGGRKNVGDRTFCVVLNQCDDGPRRRSAERIAALLEQYGVEHVVMTAFDPPERAHFAALAQKI